MYSKVSKRKKNAGCKGLLKKELMRMKKEARSVIWNTPHIDLKSKLYMEDEIYKNNWDYYGLLNTDRVWNKIYRLSLLKEAYEVL